MAVYKFIIVSILLFFVAKSNAGRIPDIKNQNYPRVCNKACQQGIDDAMDYATSISRQTNTNRENLYKRINTLGTDFKDTFRRFDNIIRTLQNLENTMARNFTRVNSRLNDEVRAAADFTTYEVGILNSDSNSKLNNLNSEINNLKNRRNDGNNNNFRERAIDVYYNITQRLDNLEYDKIEGLRVDSNMWRTNFRVVNLTFGKIKFNGDCHCR